MKLSPSKIGASTEKTVQLSKLVELILGIIAVQ